MASRDRHPADIDQAHVACHDRSRPRPIERRQAAFRIHASDLILVAAELRLVGYVAPGAVRVAGGHQQLLLFRRRQQAGLGPTFDPHQSRFVGGSGRQPRLQARRAAAS